jgi:positive regulator of sigma E activity
LKASAFSWASACSWAREVCSSSLQNTTSRQPSKQCHTFVESRLVQGQGVELGMASS